MVRSNLKGMLVAVLLGPGLAWGQQPSQPASMPEHTGEQYITLQEPGKPEQKCRILRSWQEKSNLVKEVQDLNSGEVMRVVDGTPEGGQPLVKPMPRTPGRVFRLFHFEREGAPKLAAANYQPTAVPAGSPIVQVQATMPAGASGIQQAVAPAARPTPAGDKLIKVQEPGHAVQQCRVVKSWQTPEGYGAREVQDVITGETITIVEAGSAPVQPGAAPHRPVASRLFHWGASPIRPSGAPVPPVIVEAPPVVYIPAPAENPASPVVPCGAMESSPAPAGNIAVTPAACECGNCVPVAGPCSSCTVVAGPCTDCNCKVVSGPCTDCNCTVVSSPCANCDCKVVSGPCGSGNCTVAAGPCNCSACTGCAPGSGQVVVGPINAGTAASVVVSTTPSRPSLWKRLFGGKEAVAQNCDCSQAIPAATTPTPYTTTAPSSKVARDAPTTTDWRRSWGKPDAGQVVVDGSQPATTPAWSKDLDKNRTTVTSSISIPKTSSSTTTAQAATQPPTTAKLASTALPKADKRASDPISDPKNLSKRPEIKDPDPKALAEAAKTVESKFGKGSDAKSAVPPPTAPPKEEPKVAQKVVEEGPAGKATTKAKAPLGSQSVLAAYDPKSTAQVCFLPVPVVTLPQRIPPAPPGMATSAEAGKAQAAKDDESQVNAFTPPGYAGAHGKSVDTPAGNAFTGPAMPANTVVVYGGMPGSRMPAGMPPGGMPAGAMPPGMGRPPMAMMPMPMPVSPAGYLPPQGGMMPVMPAGMPMPGQQVNPVYPPSVTSATPQQLLGILQTGLYPSQRERAAEALAKCDCKACPEVVDGLVLAAKEDPAATVRSACVRCLGKMNVNSPGVTTALQGLRTEGDPQVRQVADEVLGSDGSPKPDAEKVQPAGATDEKK